MKQDVKDLLTLFKVGCEKPKKDDLVLTAEIYRVIDPHLGEPGWLGTVEVGSVFPTCEMCKGHECRHRVVMNVSAKGGQQTIMRLKRRY